MIQILREAKRLYDLGWAVHWIKPNSKAPVKAGWSGDTRDNWKTVQAEYRKGYGLGVRLGAASKIDGGFLANIDVDLKGKEDRFLDEALAAVEKFFPDLPIEVPEIKTGSGLRFVVRTKKPLPSRRLASSPEKVDYYGEKKDAWQVEFMSAGKQVVLPPSIHPETKNPYEWAVPLEGRLPLVAPKLGNVKASSGKGAVEDFTPVEVDLIGSRLPDKTVEMILNGTGVEDRSASCFVAAMAMCRAKFTDQEIISVLTDRGTFLGETAYDHRNTGSRKAAAAWVRDYCLRRARVETDAAAAFDEVVEVEHKPGKRDWRLDLARGGQTGEGPPKPTLENTVLVLANAGAPDVFKRDLFANRDAYGVDAPWGGKKDAALTDDDAVQIKHWLGAEFNFEPGKDTIYDAMVFIAGKNAYHPVRQELEALPAWDGVARVDGWLQANFEAKGPAEYLAQVFRKWLVASVTRVYEPGAKFDWMLLLEGGQGTGKSSFGAILFGQKYFSDWLPDLGDKDAALGLQGKRCIEFGELHQLRRSELETAKAFITRQVDNVRPPYGRRSLEIYRQAVFFGTTNKGQYLKDDSGNRRFNPVEVGALDFDALHRDREQLWAEALFVYRNGLESTLYLDNGAEVFAKKIQALKMVIGEAEIMTDQIRTWHKKTPIDGRFKLMDLFNGGVWGVGGPLEKWPENGRNIQFAADALKAAGAEKIMVRGSPWWKMPEGVGGTPLPQGKSK